MQTPTSATASAAAAARATAPHQTAMSTSAACKWRCWQLAIADCARTAECMLLQPLAALSCMLPLHHHVRADLLHDCMVFYTPVLLQDLDPPVLDVPQHGQLQLHRVHGL